MEVMSRIVRLFVIITCSTRLVKGIREIHIIGFFPTTHGIPEGEIGRGVRPAVDLALQMVNNNSSLLLDYELKMYFNDSKCDMAVATKLLFDTLHDRRNNAMLFGDACFEVTGPMAQISQWWNMSQLSYADTNPILSDRTKYPRLFRVVPSDSDFNPARLALLRHFDWKKVGTIFQDASKGSSRYGYAHNKLVDLLENSSILVKSTESFADDPTSAVQNLLNGDVRIILGNFAPDMARRVFCEAYKKKMYGDKYQWILLGGYPDGWWKKTDKTVSCTKHQLKRVLHGYIATDILPLSSSKIQTESNLTSGEYLAEYNARRGNDYSKFHGYAFDGIWVIAMALDKILRGVQQTEDEWEMLFRGNELVDALDQTNFQGVTGGVKFKNGDRIGGVVIEQFQDGELVKVGEFQKDGDFLSLGRDALIWTGKGPPRDSYLRKVEMQRVHIPIYAALCVLAGLGILMALFFLSTNVYFRKHRYIKMSSPNMNNIIIVGCVMNYISVFLLGTDGGLLSPDRFPLMCSARAWVLSIGFTLAFGAMFSKTWRVHAIFTNIKLNKKVIKDYKLFFIVCVLLLLDAVIMALWQGIDPLQRSTKKLASEIVGDVEIIPLVEFCHSKHMTAWMATLYVYKGLLLVFGCFLAWETRQVSIPALNDSKYIGMSVYNVVIMCGCGAAVSFVIEDQPNAAFIIIGLFIIFCTTITLCLVFVPKVVELQRDPDGEDKRIRATLKKPSKKGKHNTSDLHEKLKLLSDENIKFKEILEEKNQEIRELLRELGEDVNSYDYSITTPVHKSVLTLRHKGNHDMSPSKVSRSSAGTEDDNASCYSDSSLTQLYLDSPEHHRHNYMNSRHTNSITESFELTDIRAKSTTGKLSPIRDSREYADADSYDPFSGVYLGPSEPEVTVVENVNYRPPATEEHPIVQRYSGVSFLDELQSPRQGDLSGDSDGDESDPDESHQHSIQSGGSIPGSRSPPEEERLLDEGIISDEGEDSDPEADQEKEEISDVNDEKASSVNFQDVDVTDRHAVTSRDMLLDQSILGPESKANVSVPTLAKLVLSTLEESCASNTEVPTDEMEGYDRSVNDSDVLPESMTNIDGAEYEAVLQQTTIPPEKDTGTEAGEVKIDPSKDTEHSIPVSEEGNDSFNTSTKNVLRSQEIFITQDLAEEQIKPEKPVVSQGASGRHRSLLSSLKHRKVAPKSKDKKADTDKETRAVMCDVVEYI